MKYSRILVVFVLLLFLFHACHESKAPINRNLTLSDYDSSDTSLYRIDGNIVRDGILRLARQDQDSLAIDSRVKNYYRGAGRFLWITRLGVDERADTFLSYLKEVERVGMSLGKFRYPQIERDLKRMRKLDFDAENHSINKVLARLEYNLTKAYLRYTIGQRFGYMNPHYVFNRLDIKEKDSLRVDYHGLYDLPTDKPSVAFYQHALRKITSDSLSVFLKEIQPRQEIYKRMLAVYGKGGHSEAEKIKLLCNLERSRWRQADYPENHSKYVWVNIPSLHLDAINGDSVLSMRMVCGTFKNKTPLLTSKITRMDVNPQWVVPQSLINRDILRHVGDWGYFTRKRFFVRSRTTGERIPLVNITQEKLRSGQYAVVQEGGEGNALGRIVFRFANNFSVFIHDTSSRELFNSEARSASHGCIRVEKPYELALFMMPEVDEDWAARLKYSMSVCFHHSEEDEEGQRWDKAKLIKSQGVKPNVPLFINYYTRYPNRQGIMEKYNDIYGYDAVIYRHLKNYM